MTKRLKGKHEGKKMLKINFSQHTVSRKTGIIERKLRNRDKKEDLFVKEWRKELFPVTPSTIRHILLYVSSAYVCH